MYFQIGVEIDNSRIVWLLNTRNNKNGNIRLTTVDDNQSKAVIKIYIKILDKRYLVFTDVITDIPKQPAGVPSININTSISGKNLLYNISLNGKPVSSGTLKTGKYTRSYKPIILAAIIAVLCAVAILIFFLLPKNQNSSSVSDKNSSTYVREDKKSVVELPETEQTKVELTEAEKPEAEQPEIKSAKTPNLPSEPAFIESEITDRHSVYFEPDTAVLTKEAILGLGSFIKDLPKENDFDEGIFELEVRGHCARYGTEEGRAELSSERAIMVFNFLKTEWKLEADSVISGAGSSEPVTLKKDEQYLNRRVDINIRGNIKKIKTSD